MKSRLYWELLDYGTFVEDEGGFYAGMIKHPDGKIYAILLSPKSEGESKQQWATSYQPIGTTGSLYDGWKNTSLNNNSTYPAFQWARSLTINGFSDWYVPSMLELEICYRNLKPTTTSNYTDDKFTGWRNAGYNVPSNIVGNGNNLNSVPNGAAYTSSVPSQTSVSVFQSGGYECFDSTWYWSSTWFDGGYAWLQYFYNGSQYNTDQTYSYYVRCVRRVAI